MTAPTAATRPGSDESSDDAPAPLTVHDLSRGRKDKPLRELPGLLRRAMRLVWAAGRRNTITLSLIAVFQSVITVVQLLLVQRLLEELPRVADGAPVRTIVPELVAFVAVYTAQSVSALANEKLRIVLGEEVARHAQSMVAGVAASANLLDFERPGFHDRLQRSLVNATSRPLQTAFATMNLLSAGLTAAAVLVTLVSVAPLLVPLLLVAFGPLWIVLRRFTRMGFEFSIAESEADRRRAYFLWLLTTKEHAPELRAYQLADEIGSRHAALWDGRLQRLRRLTRRQIRLGAAGRLINAVLLSVVLVLLVWMVSSGRADVAQAGVAAGAVFLLAQRMTAVIGALGTLYECSLFLDDLEVFLAGHRSHQEQLPTGAVPGPLEVLSADEVRFRYPAGTRDALRGVDVEVRPGEVIALVGVNGSGKTTLAKVLAGLLPPSGGAVRWNGADVADIDPEQWRANVAMVFQDYARYLLTLAENVGFGRVDRLPNTDEILDAIASAGVEDVVHGLPHGVDNLLGPQFLGGSDLSGGQWQRIALARAFFRDAPVLILDEPSAALDAEAEAALFERVRMLCVGRAVVVISHRFSTVTRADRIYVLDKGKVIESGSHRELVAQGGTYARLFRLQADRYRDDGE